MGDIFSNKHYRQDSKEECLYHSSYDYYECWCYHLDFDSCWHCMYSDFFFFFVHLKQS